MIMQPEKIVKFTSSKSDFCNLLISNLIDEQFVVSKTFESLVLKDIVKAYVPIYQYQGDYQSNWNRSYLVSKYTPESKLTPTGTLMSKNELVMEKSDFEIDSQDGIDKGNFSITVSGYRGENIPSELNIFISNAKFDSALIESFSEDKLKSDTSVQVYASNCDEKKVWEDIGKQKLNDHVKEKIEKNFKRSCINSLETEANINSIACLLAPFWFVNYVFDGKKYFFTMDGTSSQSSYTSPQSILFKTSYFLLRFLPFILGLIYSNIVYFLGEGLFDNLNLSKEIVMTSLYVVPAVLFLLGLLGSNYLSNKNRLNKIAKATTLFPTFQYIKTVDTKKKRKSNRLCNDLYSTILASIILLVLNPITLSILF